MRLLLDFLPALFCVPYPLLQIHDRIQPTHTTRYHTSPLSHPELTKFLPPHCFLPLVSDNLRRLFFPTDCSTAFFRLFRTTCGGCFFLQVALLLSSACFGQPAEAVFPYRLLYCFLPLVSVNLRKMFFLTGCSSASLCSIFSSTNQKLFIST